MQSPILVSSPKLQSDDRKLGNRRSVHNVSWPLSSLTNASIQGKHKREDSGLTFALQALLERHEAYVKESQAEQARLSSHVTDLEHENTVLQGENHKIVVENKELLHKLEELNSNLGQNSQRVNELETLLEDCDQEIRRLNNLARKTEELELKMLDMERERMELNKQVEEGKLETRSHVARWRESEKKIRELEHEVQKIEFEARLDREKHESVVARMGKERALERELGLSEGRLKATAAVQNMRKNGAGEKQVVSNFVRDILQDNANLQAGIAELQGLLQSSNDEVQNLREQVMMHQPVLDNDTPTQQRTLSLGEELGFSQSLPQQVQQEVHVHHHYHSKAAIRKEKTITQKRSTRRRAIMPNAASFSSPSSSGASTPLMKPYRHTSSPAVPLSIQPLNSKTNRWSMLSNTTASTYMSSMASSPRSYFDKNNSIFDRLEAEEDLSRPTSPDSLCIASPLPFKRKERQNEQPLSTFEEESLPDTEDDDRSTNAPADNSTADTETGFLGSSDRQDDEQPINAELTPKPSMILQPSSPKTQERLVSVASQHSSQAPDPDTGQPFETRQCETKPTGHETSQVHGVDQVDCVPQDDRSRQYFPTYPELDEIRPSLRRSNSHESLVSISGMDIHLAQHTNRPGHSALTLLRTSGANKHHFAPSPASTRKVSATQPVAAVTEYTAMSRPALDHQPSASMLALSGLARNNVSQLPDNSSRGLIGSVGGWVSRKWRIAPTKSSTTGSGFPTGPKPASSSAVFTQSNPATTLRHRTMTDSISASSISSNAASTKHSVVSKAPEPSEPRISTTTSTSVPIPAAINQQADLKTSNPTLFATGTPMRNPGINQFGAIPGFAATVAARKAPTEIEAKQVNLSGLQESLVDD